MKTIKFLFAIIMFAFMTSNINAQTINWTSFTPEHKHIFGVSAGLEYGLVYGANYGYQLKTKFVRAALGAEVTVPSGNVWPMDDFKTKIGGELNWIDFRGLQINTKIHGVFRCTNNDFNTLVNFGSEASLVIGYFRPHWFAAGEIGFDKAIVTRFKHSAEYRDQYHDAVGGWYEPAQAGNMHYGLQFGFSYQQYDIYMRGGKMITENFNATPAFPFYAQVGCAVRFSGLKSR